MRRGGARIAPPGLFFHVSSFPRFFFLLLAFETPNGWRDAILDENGILLQVWNIEFRELFNFREHPGTPPKALRNVRPPLTPPLSWELC